MKAICDNCGGEWPQDKLNPIKNICERVAAGELLPSGECPSCGALCHVEQRAELHVVAHRQHEHGALALFGFSSEAKAWKYAAQIVADELEILGNEVGPIVKAIEEGRYEEAVELWHQLAGNNDSIDVEPIEIDVFDCNDEIELPQSA